MIIHRPQPDDRQVGIGPPRFSLRTLLLIVTVAGCLFGVMSVLGTLWSMGMLMILCLIFAHVAGNSLGTTLRDQATRHAAEERRERLLTNPIVAARHEAPAPSQLTKSSRLNRVTLVMTAGGAIAGGALGGTLSADLYPEAGIAALVLGVVSAAVLGGFVGFTVSAFVSVARAALGEALHNCDPATGRFSKPR
jgi:ABC-type antimicrobial peptide transport system permease subunit